jgi:hypothetical protein
MTDTTVTGIVLLTLVPLVVANGVLEARAGFMSEFWRLPLDGKLDRIADMPRHWAGMGAIWVGTVAAVAAGMTGLTVVLVDAGAGVVAGLALGGFLVTTTGWLIGVIAQTVGAGQGAKERRETGDTPGWLPPVWMAAWWSELTWVVVSNLALVVWGFAILDSGAVARWAGWTFIGIGAVVVLAVAWLRDVFPQLALLGPIVAGVALVLS